MRLKNSILGRKTASVYQQVIIRNAKLNDKIFKSLQITVSLCQSNFFREKKAP